METKLICGKSGDATTTVTEANTAKAVGSGSLDVFATPMMIALMERAACVCLADALAEGQTSVGTHISAAHTAASPIGADITATATVTSISGRKVVFAVTARDAFGEIGRGEHTRAIVDSESFLARVGARV